VGICSGSNEKRVNLGEVFSDRRRALVDDLFQSNCQTKINVTEDGGSTDRSTEIRLFYGGSPEVGPKKVGPAEVGPAEVGLAEVGLAEVGLAELGPAEVVPAEVGLVKV
jgi:hypothetical protein